MYRPSNLRRPAMFTLSLLFWAATTFADDAKLVVHVKEIRDATGNVRVSIYRDLETFRKEDRAVQVVSIPAAPGETVVEFPGLTPGRYALMAYHDENGDAKLNLRFGMFPTEGYALSNAPKVMGPPKFSDSAFDLVAPETRVSLILSY